MTPDDDLSRLLDGELPPEEADRLRARIATDPELARRWAVLQALPRRLAALPRTLERGQDVSIRIPGQKAGSPEPVPAIPKANDLTPRRVRAAVPWLGWALAAGLAFAALRPEPTRVLVAGTEMVDGHADVLAADVRVEVDGVARVTVEPPDQSRRGVDAEIDPMDHTHLFAALAGSLVTVTVLEGAAWLHPADGPVSEVHAGESRTIRCDDDSPAPHRGRGMRHDRPASEGAPVSKAAPADDRVASLERELAQAKLEKSAALGQLRRTQGDVQDWPPDVRPALRPDAFERFVRDRLAAVPDAELVDMDCDEYPCVAILRSHSKADDWEDQLVTVHDGLSDAGFGDDLHIVGLGSHAESDDHDVRLYAFGVAPADASDDVHTRLKFRASSDLEDLTAELAGSSAR